MSDRSSIEWTDATWNPTTGCHKVSPGCAHCYAERLAERFRGTPAFPVGFDLALRSDRLRLPLRWKEPRRIFVNSMSDLFHPDVPRSYIEAVFAVMREAGWHRFQILTKRSERLRELGPQLDWPANVWMGVSVENQRWASRVDDLRSVPCAIRFLSLEPLLGPVSLDLKGIHWVIVGGESGPGARRMLPEWVVSVQSQCDVAGVPFFFKQWGAFDPQGVRRGKNASGRLFAGQTWDAMPS